MDKLMRPSELVDAPVTAKAELPDKGRYEKAKGVRGDEYNDQGGRGEYDTRDGGNVR